MPRDAEIDLAAPAIGTKREMIEAAHRLVSEVAPTTRVPEDRALLTLAAAILEEALR